MLCEATLDSIRGMCLFSICICRRVTSRVEVSKVNIRALSVLVYKISIYGNTSWLFYVYHIYVYRCIGICEW